MSARNSWSRRSSCGATTCCVTLASRMAGRASPGCCRSGATRSSGARTPRTACSSAWWARRFGRRRQVPNQAGRKTSSMANPVHASRSRSSGAPWATRVTLSPTSEALPCRCWSCLRLRSLLRSGCWSRCSQHRRRLRRRRSCCPCRPGRQLRLRRLRLRRRTRVPRQPSAHLRPCRRRPGRSRLRRCARRRRSGRRNRRYRPRRGIAHSPRRRRRRPRSGAWTGRVG